jgi:hypothetical protein
VSAGYWGKHDWSSARDFAELGQVGECLSALKNDGDGQLANASSLVSTIATAKAAFVVDPSTSPTGIQQFSSAPDANFASIAPYIRVNGVQSASEDDLRKLEGLPASTSIALGTVDDSGLGGSNTDQAPSVTFTHARTN